MKSLLCIFAIVALIGCKTSTDTTSPNNSNNNGSTASFFKVDGTSSNPGADAASVTRVGGVTKGFNFGSGGSALSCALQITFHKTNFSNLSDDVAEGGSRTLYITTHNYTDSKDSAEVLIEIDNYPTGIYDLKASSGKIFLTKKHDTLGCASSGTLTVTGKNNLPPYESQTRTTEFSIRNGVAF